ncbi:MAG: alpha-galactosidase [Chloroflexi bacterium]|nr:alpha-galactosidase [Chloroflexota bacterium]
MPITWRDADRELHLHNGLLSLVLRVHENGWLGQLHAGAPLDPGRSYAHLAALPFTGFSNRLDDPLGFAVPTAGSGDFRIPALVVEGPDGATVLDLAYVAHRIAPGKPALDGLPSTYVEGPDEATTVEVDLRDGPTALTVTLVLTIFEGRAAIARSMRLANHGRDRLVIRTAMSASLDLPAGEWDVLTFSGAWARERHPYRSPLVPGRRSVGSLRGASGHQQDPSIFLVRPETTEEHGEGFAVSLVYSGNFLAEAELGARGATRARIGLPSEGFAWTLLPGATFTTPEAVMAWSNEGLGGLSDTLHDLYRERLARGRWRDRPRPVLLNSWEGVYYDFDHDRLLEMARAAADLGVELFVLDDGWFGERDSDTTSLGDWIVDHRKLPDGLGRLAADMEGLGLSLGLWIEPEMVSPVSRLFAEHPDWAIGVPGRARTESRQQLVLDLSRPEVVDHLEGAFAEILANASVRYVKWDMNRNITEPYGATLPPDRQGEFFHRYMLGTYELWRRLTTRFPEILFESCAGGGGRFDPGMLAYAPQGWTSDDTDAIERLAIQWGTSHVYPLSSMAAHVSAVPNHQVGRVTPLATRAAVAFFGLFGYELDPRHLSADERAEIRDQIAFYRRHRELFQRGRFVRLRAPFGRDDAAWMVVASDRRSAIVARIRILDRPVRVTDRLQLRGLDPGLSYAVETWPAPSPGGRVRRGGDLLQSVGLGLEPSDPPEQAPRGDFRAWIWVLTAE